MFTNKLETIFFSIKSITNYLIELNFAHFLGVPWPLAPPWCSACQNQKFEGGDKVNFILWRVTFLDWDENVLQMLGNFPVFGGEGA